MSLVINSNISALSAQNVAAKNQSSLETSMERLSSGRRINSAKDDAAGYAVAQEMTKQIKGFDQAVRNANDGISFLQTAQGGLEEIANMSQRMRELAVQAQSGTYSGADLANLNAEYQQLDTEVTRIAGATKFNSVGMLDGTAAIEVQVGWENGDEITLASADFSAALGGDLLSTANAETAATAIDGRITAINTAAASFGALENRLDHTVNNLRTSSENLQAARSRIVDADYGKESTNMARNNILQQASTAMLAQANSSQQSVLQLLR